MIFQVGMIVEHSTEHGWGPGKVIAVRDEKVHVVFRDVSGREAKTFPVNTNFLTESVTQNDPILSNIPPLKEENGKFVLPRERITVPQAIENFLKYFPQGFEDSRYLGGRGTGERTYKLEAHRK
jgi:hypothetical protein